MKTRLLNTANEDRMVIVKSTKYTGTAVFTKYCRWRDKAFIRVNCRYYEVSPKDIVKFLPKGELTSPLYGN